MEITPDIIEEIEDVFNRWIIGSIKDLSKSEGISLAFVLMSCAIDYLASFNIGGETNPNDYKNFLRGYKWFIKKYNPDDIYHSLRCGLVHNFTIKDGKYTLIHKRPDLHLKIDPKGKIILNFEDFFKDFKRLKKEYFKKIKDPKNKKAGNFFKRFQTLGFLMKLLSGLKARVSALLCHT